MPNELIFISGFILFIILMLAIDLGLFAKAGKPITLRRAAIMSIVWVSFALLFFGLLYRFGESLHSIHSFATLNAVNTLNHHHLNLSPIHYTDDIVLYRHTIALEYLTGYIVEYALSVDNIFVMVLIFVAFGVDPVHYHKVLFWGILGALLMRFLFVFTGAALISRFEWILYLFGLFLVYTGTMMYLNRNQEELIDTKNHRVVKFASKYFAVYPAFKGNRFFIKLDGRNMITPLFLVLLIIEFTDLVFAVDSIPAVFSVTKDPYLVFFSNIFAIMGLRSMFFLLVNTIDKFHYLKTGLAVLLVFIGLKMLFGNYADAIGLNTPVSLLIILAILGTSIAASLLFPLKKTGLKTGN